jgi:hypothetical protein
MTSSALLAERGRGLGGRDRRGDDDPRRAALASAADRGAQRAAGRDAVVDEDHGPAVDVRRRGLAAVELGAAANLGGALVNRRAQLVGRDAGPPHRLLVEHERGTFGERAHPDLGLDRHADLAYEPHVERRVERECDLVGDRHAAARQPAHDQWPRCEVEQRPGEPLAGLAAVAELAPPRAAPRRQLGQRTRELVDAPLGRELRDLVERAGLVEVMARARDHRELGHRRHPVDRHAIELEHRVVIAADDEQGRRAHDRQRGAREVGATGARHDGARHDGADHVRPARCRAQRSSRRGAVAEIRERQMAEARLVEHPARHREQPLGEHVDVEPQRRIDAIEVFFGVGEQIDQQRGEPTRTERLRHVAVARARPTVARGMRDDHETDRALGHSEAAAQIDSTGMYDDVLDKIVAAEHVDRTLQLPCLGLAIPGIDRFSCASDLADPLLVARLARDHSESSESRDSRRSRSGVPSRCRGTRVEHRHRRSAGARARGRAEANHADFTRQPLHITTAAPATSAALAVTPAARCVWSYSAPSSTLPAHHAMPNTR